jgi:hypothetical protein
MKTNQKIILLATVLLVSKSTPVYAINATQGARIQQRNEIKEEIKERRGDLKDLIASKTAQIKNFISNRAVIKEGVVTGKGSNTLTVTSEGKTVTVNIDSNTRLRRRFYGKATIGEISINDKLNITGKWTDENHTAINANLIRDMSIQKRFGVFVGDVTAINGSDITINSLHRGTQKVTISQTTKIENRKEQTISQTDVIVGHKIRVKGMWDSANNTVTEVSQVKDYSLPIKVTPTPKP